MADFCRSFLALSTVGTILDIQRSIRKPLQELFNLYINNDDDWAEILSRRQLSIVTTDISSDNDPPEDLAEETHPPSPKYGNLADEDEASVDKAQPDPEEAHRDTAGT